METVIPLGIIFVISIIANIFMFWYIRNLLSKMLFISENLGDLVSMVKAYAGHLKSVYSLDMYRGDETIQFLMSHTTSFSEMLEEYEDVYSMSIPIEEDESLEHDEGEQQQKEVELDGENVFYAGSRKRDT